MLFIPSRYFTPFLSYKNWPLPLIMCNGLVYDKLRDEDIVKICELVDFKISKSALNDFFRKESHPKYVPAGDQILRNFLNGLI